jgi:hypothetical protein
MNRLRDILLALTLVAPFAMPESGLSAGDFPQIVESVRQVLAQRKFESDDGFTMAFGVLRRGTNYAGAEIDVVMTTADGSRHGFIERYFNGSSQVTMDQIFSRNARSTFLATFEAPYRVLRIRPLDSNNPDLISRECFFDARINRNVCYFKIRQDGSVYFRTFKEVKF